MNELKKPSAKSLISGSVKKKLLLASSPYWGSCCFSIFVAIGIFFLIVASYLFFMTKFCYIHEQWHAMFDLSTDYEAGLAQAPVIFLVGSAINVMEAAEGVEFKCSSSAEATTGSGSVCLASDKIDPVTESAIESNLPIYKQAAEAEGIPWEMLAAVHYRERNNGLEYPSNGDGLYQVVSASYPTSGTATDAEFLEMSKEAARILKQKAEGGNNKFILSATPSDEAVKDSFWGYNGEAYGSADNSPYVMNNFDSAHTNMKIDTCDVGYCEGTDTRNGAFTVYKELQGSICKQGNIIIPQGDIPELSALVLANPWITDQNGEKKDIENHLIKKPILQFLLVAADYKHEYGGGDFRIEISALQTDHDCPSFHCYGVGMDIGNESIAPELLPWIHANLLETDLRPNELFSCGVNQVYMPEFGKWNMDNGHLWNACEDDAKIKATHMNHIHLAYFKQEE